MRVVRERMQLKAFDYLCDTLMKPIKLLEKVTIYKDGITTTTDLGTGQLVLLCDSSNKKNWIVGLTAEYDDGAMIYTCQQMTGNACIMINLRLHMLQQNKIGKNVRDLSDKNI
jgi:hypothetical protein